MRSECGPGSRSRSRNSWPPRSLSRSRSSARLRSRAHRSLSTLDMVAVSGVAARDHGAWTCVISDNLSLDTTKQVVSLGVAVGGHLELSQLPGQNTLLCRCSV